MQAPRAGLPASVRRNNFYHLAVTLSRQSGCGAHFVATALAEQMQARTPSSAPPWTIFDRNLVEKVLEEHNLPARLARFMPEDRVHDLMDALDELLGLHPPVWTLVQRTTATILHLAARGNVVLIGRGSHVITSTLAHVFHVRLVGSLTQRIERVQASRGLTKAEALNAIRREDRGRERYLKRYFGRDIDDPLAYDMVVNTDSISYDRAAKLIGDAALEHLYAAQSVSITEAVAHPDPGLLDSIIEMPFFSSHHGQDENIQQ